MEVRRLECFNSQAATAEESKYPRNYIDMSGLIGITDASQRKKDLSYFEKNPKDISILNNDFDFDDRGNPCSHNCI